MVCGCGFKKEKRGSLKWAIPRREWFTKLPPKAEAEIIKENELGLVCNPDNLEEIKSTFEMAINQDETQRLQYSKNCEILTNTVFNKELIVDNLLELLKRGWYEIINNWFKWFCRKLFYK